MSMLSSGIAAFAIGAHDFACKALITTLVRLRWVMASGEKERKAVLDDKFNKHHHSTQLNTAEYAPWFMAALFYLHSKGVEAPMASTLAVVGCIGYHTARLATGQSIPGAPFASMRYIAMGMLLKDIYGTLQ